MFITGCTSLGAHLATRLAGEGCAVRLLDRVAASFSNLPDRLQAACIDGDPLDLDVLRCAGIEKAEFVLATSHEDDLNAATSLVALRVFGAPHVFARIDDPDRAASYEQLGITTVCSPPMVAAAFLQRIESIARE
ncbi:MAG: TrkA family potassium uptake protein [Planctomycetes bacterium]|nr:TrkA family potassium uptake protein [Planctomycetota bacterium]